MTRKESTEATTTERPANFLTPYKAAGIVNARLKEEGLKVIPPQMMYNYTSARVNAGKKPAVAFTHETGVDREDLNRWIEEYVAKKLAGSRKAEAEETVEA